MSEQPVPAADRDAQKRLATVVLVPSFYFIEWLLVAATASVFVLLRHHGLSDRQIWLLFWVANVAISGAVVLCNDRLGIDITLMQTLRKLVDAATRRAKWVGLPLEAALFVRLLIWDGPCQLLIFFRERLPSRTVRVCFFVVAGGLQMFVWARIYALGYEGFLQLIPRWKGLWI
jgi:hypothetical protein